MNYLKTLNFIDVEDFCSMLIDVFSDEADEPAKGYTSVIATYDTAREIIAELLDYGYKLGCIDLDCEYFDEYEITVIENDIYCCVLKRDEKYVYSGATNVYAIEDTNSKCILESFPDATEVFIIELDSEYSEDIDDGFDQEDYDDDELNCASDYGVKLFGETDADDKVHGMTISSSNGDKYISHSIYCTDAFDYIEMLDCLTDIFGL